MSLLFLTSLLFFTVSQPSVFNPGEIWPDNRGQHIQAHGGGITKYKDTYYWFGEDRDQTNDPSKRYVSCYSSKNLADWTFKNKVLRTGDPANLGRGFVLERPKVFYNAKTKLFVMYVHLDSRNYGTAEVGVFTSKKIDGDYQFVKAYRPLGKESRDIGQFVDDDGKAYLIFESRPSGGFYIAQLSEDYLDVAREICFIHKPLEGGGLVHYKGLYYVIGSRLTGWDANPNLYATSKSLSGPWSEFKDIAPPKANTYGAQSSMMVKVDGRKKTTVIFLADIWKPNSQWDSRYLWMPLTIGDGNLFVPQPQRWTLDIKSGEVTFP